LRCATPHIGFKRPTELDLANGLRSFDGQITVPTRKS
jgi:hypothetical protein